LKRYLALRWTETYPNAPARVQTSLVTFIEDEPDRMYWGLDGMSHTLRPRDYEILQEWPVEDDPDYDAIELDYYRNHRPAIPSTERGYTSGWIAPDGTFYACAYGGHEGLAYRIWVTLFGKSGHSGMLENTWIKLSTHTVIENEHLIIEVTQAQRDTLMDIITGAEEYPEWQRQVLRALQRLNGEDV
jgi:hypothetical protein